MLNNQLDTAIKEQRLLSLSETEQLEAILNRVSFIDKEKLN